MAPSFANRAFAAMSRLYTASRPLTIVSLLMLLVLAASGVGLLVDDRVITGAPAWLKPAKFAVSTAVYGLTLAWVFTYLPEWTRTRRIVGRITAAVFVLEVGIIDLQAWRGTTSHFNVSTPFDAALFGVMGSAILLQTVSSGWVVVALFRHRFADPGLGSALRAGMLLTLVGALTGGLMTRPTDTQLAAARVSHELTTSGAHTVGGPDDGAGLPVTHWSREHGDLRIPHFVGLHALQALGLLSFALARREGGRGRVAVMRAAAASYAALFGILLLQALRGEPLTDPSPLIGALLFVWIAFTGVIAVAAAARPARPWQSPAAAV
jgi:hypothetical protein